MHLIYLKREPKAYDIILIDQHLGPKSRIDGLELTKNVLTIDPDAKVIIYTQAGDRKSSIEALNAGACRYLYRSADPEEMLAVVESLADLRELEEEIKNGIENNFWLNQVVYKQGFGISIIDRSYRILYANEEQLRISNEGARVGGICWVELNQAYTQKEPCPWCAVKKVFEDGQPHETTTLSPVGGEIRYFHSKVTPIFSKDHHVIAAVEALIDITEKEQLLAMPLDERINRILLNIQSLGYDRARLYLLSPESDFIVGRFQVGGLKNNADIRSIKLDVKKDSCTYKSLKSRGPCFYPKGYQGRTTELDDILEKDKTETGWLDIPLLIGHRAFGKITIDNKWSGKSLREGDEFVKESLMIYANHAAKILDEFNKQEAIKKKAMQLEKLRELESEISKKDDLDERLQIIIDSCLELLGTVEGHIRLYENGYLKLVVKRGVYSEKIVEDKIDIKSGSETGSAIVYRTGRSEIVNDASKNNHFVNTVEKKVQNEDTKAKLENIKSFATFPLKSPEGKVIGTLSVQSSELGFFTKEVCQLAEDFVRMASLAIIDAKRVDEEEHAPKELKNLAQLSSYLQTERNIERLYGAAIAGLVMKDIGIREYKKAALFIMNDDRLTVKAGICTLTTEEFECFRSEQPENININICIDYILNLQNKDICLKRLNDLSIPLDYLRIDTPYPFTISSETNDGIWQEILTKLQSKRLFAVPLISRNHIIGVILTETEFRMDARAIESERELLNIYGTHVAIAIENAELDQKLKTFLSSVSHELKSPIAGLDMLLQAVEKDLQNKEASGLALKELGREMWLINNLIDHAKIESGTITPNKKCISLESAIKDVESLIQTSFERKQKTLKVENPSALSVIADAGMLKSILINLIENAIRYSLESTPIKLRAEPWHESFVKITVTNDGKGITNEQISKILQADYYLHRRDNKEKGGLGLGFEIIKSFTKILGGSVGIESNPNIQTEVWVMLPVCWEQTDNKE